MNKDLFITIMCLIIFFLCYSLAHCELSFYNPKAKRHAKDYTPYIHATITGAATVFFLGCAKEDEKETIEAVCLIAGNVFIFGKELADWKDGGRFDIRDILGGELGIFSPIICRRLRPIHITGNGLKITRRF